MVGCEVRPIKYLGGMFSGLGIMDGPHGPVVRIISEAPQVPESTYRSWAGSLMGPNSHDWMVFEETAKSGGGSMTSSAHSRAWGALPLCRTSLDTFRLLPATGGSSDHCAHGHLQWARCGRYREEVQTSGPDSQGKDSRETGGRRRAGTSAEEAGGGIFQ